MLTPNLQVAPRGRTPIDLERVRVAELIRVACALPPPTRRRLDHDRPGSAREVAVASATSYPHRCRMAR